MLYQMEIDYEYERVCDGTTEPGRLRPDFSFVKPDGDLIVWEHLGMLDRPDLQARVGLEAAMVRAQRLRQRRDSIHFDRTCWTRPGLRGPQGHRAYRQETGIISLTNQPSHHTVDGVTGWRHNASGSRGVCAFLRQCMLVAFIFVQADNGLDGFIPFLQSSCPSQQGPGPFPG